MEDIYFRGVWRMDWGFGNPNKTAALIAVLMVAVWTLAYVRRWGFWLALALFTGLGVCLVHTISRGGLIALGAGLLMLSWHLSRPWPLNRAIAVVGSLVLLVCVAVHLQAHARFIQGIVKEDRSISNRLKIWSQVPKMMVDAPNGWGAGRANEAFMQWYQSTEAPEAYLNLVNSHFTWMVEMSWFWRFCYVLGWVAVLLLCWPVDQIRWAVVPLCVWLSFGTAAIFTHVTESLWMWMVPGCFLSSVLAIRGWRRVWPPLRLWGISATLAGSVLTVFWAIGTMSGVADLHIRGTKNWAILGENNPRIWIVVDTKVMGSSYGKTLRRFWKSWPSPPGALGIATSLDAIPTGETIDLVVSGSPTADELKRLQKLLANASRFVFLNPTFYPQELGLNNQSNREKFAVVFGEFSQSPAVSAWADLCRIERMNAAGDFLPRWPELIYLPKSR